MKELLIATTNPGKLKEFKTFLSYLPLKLVSLKDLKITHKPNETGKTFAENAILKAKFYYKLSGLPTLADDGGFEIDVLHGEPGVLSHRWMDPTRENTDEELISYTLKRLHGIPLEKRTVQLRLVLALILPDQKVVTVAETERGIIPLKASAKQKFGYPYRSLLYFPEIQKYYVELNQQEMDRYNHRKRAVDKLKPISHQFLTL